MSFWLKKEADGVEFSAGKEPWLKALHKINWQTFVRVCTQEMDDLSQRAVKLVLEYCLEVLEKVEETIRGKASLARLEATLGVQYAEKYENRAFQFPMGVAPSGLQIRGTNNKTSQRSAPEETVPVVLVRRR